jgi:hypothetical protein
MGLFNLVSLGQVRITIKSSKIEALGPPIDSLGCFGQKFKRTIFERTTLSQMVGIQIESKLLLLLMCLDNKKLSILGTDMATKSMDQKAT